MFEYCPLLRLSPALQRNKLRVVLGTSRSTNFSSMVPVHAVLLVDVGGRNDREIQRSFSIHLHSPKNYTNDKTFQEKQQQEHTIHAQAEESSRATSHTVSTP